jgi:hypothetical protein
MRRGTFLQLLKTLKGDLKLVGRAERGRIVLDLDTEQRDDRHCDSGASTTSTDQNLGVRADSRGSKCTAIIVVRVSIAEPACLFMEAVCRS